ncbi:transglycosylase SLT domain-containing protein [uncultured Thiodictyon sp.]|uniref:transglycosylase SLT domain-containing protein n=1 Tax=uncultured Thiodictyon sp. TaxID=1846217 RepID=UPI0025FE9508|nr:transglycosylase SLT domain-containing protein [uncultured Thiodictyon sp.]
MLSSTPTARHRGARLPLFLAVLAVSGCASKQTRNFADVDDYGNQVSAREYGYVRPSGAARRGGTAGSSGDLWTRVRADMKLNLHASGRIDEKVSTFRRDPQFMLKLSERAKPYLHVVMAEIQRRGLPAELALLPHIESRYNPAATSPVAAAGMWQFMPYTGREMGLRQDAWQDERRDVMASTRAAMDYLQQLQRRLGGNWELAMAAYNCGPARVESAQAANRARGLPTDFWSLSLPAETQNYVPQILAAARLVAEPSQNGVRLPPVPSAPQLEVVRTDRPVDLARVAQASGVGLAQLQTLNAGLKRGQTSPVGPGQLVVPAGTGSRVTAALPQSRVMAPMMLPAAVQPAEPPRKVKPEGTVYTVYKVKGGDTLAAIARARGVDLKELADANAMQTREPLLPGQSLRVPGTDRATVGGDMTAANLVTHRVHRGDSLRDIARRYNVTVDDLVRWNPVAANELHHGAVIRIYRRTPAFASL